MESTSKNYTVGITITSKEQYDDLMQNYSVENHGFFLDGIDFKGLFEGYPEEDQYPCLVQYGVGMHNPFLFPLSTQMTKLVQAGFHIHIMIDDEEP